MQARPAAELITLAPLTGRDDVQPVAPREKRARRAASIALGGLLLLRSSNRGCRFHSQNLSNVDEFPVGGQFCHGSTHARISSREPVSTIGR